MMRITKKLWASWKFGRGSAYLAKTRTKKMRYSERFSYRSGQLSTFLAHVLIPSQTTINNISADFSKSTVYGLAVAQVVGPLNMSGWVRILTRASYYFGELTDFTHIDTEL